MHYTLPPAEQMIGYERKAQDYMKPNRTPFMVVYEEALSEGACNRILLEAMGCPAHRYDGCGGLTREMRINAATTQPVKEFLAAANSTYFRVDISPNTVGYVQEYGPGDAYDLHMDGGPGQSRKLTALVMLSDETEYTGGDLWFHMTPAWWQAPKMKGTIIVFPFWLNHLVQPVRSGLRHTLNLGVWGPEWR